MGIVGVYICVHTHTPTDLAAGIERCIRHRPTFLKFEFWRSHEITKIADS